LGTSTDGSEIRGSTNIEFFFGCLNILMLDPKLQGYGGGFKELGSTENWKETKSAFQWLMFPEKLQGPKTAVVVLGLWGLNGYLNTGSITGYDWFALGINHNFFPPLPFFFVCLTFQLRLFLNIPTFF